MSQRSRREKLVARNRAQHRGSFRYEDAAWMCEAYAERGLTLRQMAVEANCALRTIARWMEIHGIPTDSARRPQRRTGADHPSWKGGRPTCPKCGNPCAYYAEGCMTCKDVQGPANPNWRGSGIGYGAAHERVKRLRGLASAHTCAHCPSPAREWAYDHADPGERREAGKRDAGPYSLDPNHYIPLCDPCHTRFDFPGPTHGTYSRYSNQGCRCVECRTASREYQREHRRRQRALVVPPP
jgi:hypothetical protein